MLLFSAKSKLLKLCPTLLRLHGLYPARLLCPWHSTGKKTGVGRHSLSKGSSRPRFKPESPALQAVSLPTDLPRKPNNTGVGCHFLLQGTFLILGIQPASPALAERFLTTEPPGKTLFLIRSIKTRRKKKQESSLVGVEGGSANVLTGKV